MKHRRHTLTWAAALVIGASAGLIGCSEDGSEHIIGSWERTAITYSYSGSPNAGNNYSNHMTMEECDGCEHMVAHFFEDKTGMITRKWIDDHGESRKDTLRFSYSIDGDEGTLTPIADGQKADWTTTRSILGINKNTMTLYEKQVAENYADYTGDTSPYTRVIERSHRCKKMAQ